MGMTGALRGAAIALAGSLVVVAPATAAVADSALPTKIAKPAAAKHVPTTTSGGLSPQVQALAGDAPNTIPAVTTTSAANVWLAEAIQSSGDNDIYRFLQSRAGYVRILLGDQVDLDTGQTNDYAVILYDRNGRELKRSVRGGGIAEEIYISLPAATYYVRVLRQTGGLYEAPANPYVVRFQQYADTMAFNGLNFYQAPNGGWYLAGEAINNTSQNRAVTLSVTVYNAANQVIKTANGATFHPVVGPRGRSPFQFTLGALTDPDHYVTRIVGTPSTLRPISGLSILHGEPTDDGAFVTFPGSITNTGTVNRTNVRVAESLFSNRGELLYLGYEPVVYALARGQRHNYAIRVAVTDGTVSLREDYTGR
jgi:hypothetical protein